MTNIYAQRGCATDQKMKEFFQKNPQALARKADLRNFLINKNNTAKLPQSVITIPVVIHVLYKNATQNISDAQIASQIAVLNNDFRKMNSDFNTVVPNAFKPNTADLELTFCMATKDPNGNPTTGIERKSVPSNFNFNNFDYFESPGLVGWDSTKYLNIWVGELPAGDLGWAFFPDVAGLDLDGLAISYQCFGTIGTASAPFNKGRTTTHEIGHYLGLEHIWGYGEYTCGTPDNDDFCADTPATDNPYNGTPTFPDNQLMCTPSANGAMFMNFMDYVDDAAMAMFTNDQKTITSNTMAGPRASLLNANGCSSAVLGTSESEKATSINVFPSPTTEYVSIASPLVKINEVEIFNAEGRLVRKAFIKNETDKINVKEFAAGVYYVRTYSDKQFVKSLKFIKK